jgi:hypothetical protein
MEREGCWLPWLLDTSQPTNQQHWQHWATRSSPLYEAPWSWPFIPVIRRPPRSDAYCSQLDGHPQLADHRLPQHEGPKSRPAANITSSTRQYKGLPSPGPTYHLPRTARPGGNAPACASHPPPGDQSAPEGRPESSDRRRLGNAMRPRGLERDGME